MPANEKPLANVLQRASLVRRLYLAAGLLAGQGWPDSSASVLQAIDLIHTLPTTPVLVPLTEYQGATTDEIADALNLKPVAHDDHDGSTPD